MRLVACIASAAIAVVLAGASSANGVAGGRVGLARPHTNILIFTFDDMGREWLHDYNPDGSDGAGPLAGAPDDMPELSTLADEGVRFNWVAGAPSCGPFRSQLYSGRYWTRIGQMDNSGTFYVPENETPIPAMIEASWPGWYRMGHFGELGLGSTSDWKEAGRMGWPYSWGILGPFVSDPTDWNWYEAVATSRADEDITLADSGTLSTSSSDAFVSAFSAWLTASNALDGQQPFYAQVEFDLPHAPVHDPADGSACPGTEAACFVAMRQKVDASIGAVLDLIPPEVMAHTLVLVFSDNGTAIVNTGMSLPDYTYCGGKGTPCEDGTGVVALAAGGVVANGGRVDDVKRSIVDVLPTIMDYAHAEEAPTFAPNDVADDRYNGQPYVLDGISWRAALSQDCPSGAPCDATHDVVFYPGGGVAAYPPSGNWGGILQDGHKLETNSLTGLDYFFALTESVFAEGVEPDLCGWDGDCSELVGTDLTKITQIRDARTALDAASP